VNEYGCIVYKYLASIKGLSHQGRVHLRTEYATVRRYFVSCTRESTQNIKSI